MKPGFKNHQMCILGPYLPSVAGSCNLSVSMYILMKFWSVVVPNSLMEQIFRHDLYQQIINIKAHTHIQSGTQKDKLKII